MMARPRRPKIEAPTKDLIVARKQEAERYWNPLHADMDRDDEYFNLKRKVSAPAPYDQDIIYPPTGNSIVITLADHVAGDSPQIRVPEANDTLKAQGRSERMEKGLQASLVRFREVKRMDPIRALVISAGWSGMLASKGPIFDPSAWGLKPERDDYRDESGYDSAMGEYEARKRTEWPFYWEICDPRTVFADPGTHGRNWVIVTYQRLVGDIAAQWPEWDRRTAGMSKSDPPMPEDSKVEWVEYWDRHHRAYMVGGDFIDGPREHRYGKPPFQIRASGLGKETGDPEEVYRSMLFPVRNLLDAQIKTKSQMSVIIRNTAWSTFLSVNNSGFTKMEPGKVVQMKDADSIRAVRSVTELRPEVAGAIEGHAQSIDSDIEEGTYPQVVKGIKARGIASGYGQNSLVAQAKVRFGPVAVALQSLLSEFFSDFLRCVETVVEEPVPIWGPLAGGFVDAELDPKDINGYYFNIVTVSPKIPGEDAIALQEGEHLLSLGAIDMGTFSQRYAGVENPGEMHRLVLRDKIMNSPEFVRMATIEAAVQTGLIDRALDIAQQWGIDPSPLLQVLGFGVPGQQQMPNTPAPANPANQAAQSTLAARPDSTAKAQPINQPGPQQAVRNAAVPGMPISA